MPSGLERTVRDEFAKWEESDVETAFIQFIELDGKDASFTLGEEEDAFTVTLPAQYPKIGRSDLFVVSSGAESLEEWVSVVNEWAEENKGDSDSTLENLLTRSAEAYFEVFGDEDEDEDDESGIEDFLAEDDDMGMGGIDEPQQQQKEERELTKEEQELEDKEFLEIGTPAATMRLVTDLKNIYRSNSQDLGFSVAPVTDAKSGLENLYHWHAKLFNFEKGSDLAKDMAKYQKKTGKDHILIELRFSGDYPFFPPFVRVVQPRFAFRTGHVTIGGSICMELLTMSGWNSTNDIESILIQIRAELLGGGAKLDPNMTGSFAYSESEAWDAFRRAAATHGWDISALGPQKLATPP